LETAQGCGQVLQKLTALGIWFGFGKNTGEV
jgi:hypothetical protein